VPDRNLGAYIEKAVPEKKFILFSGYCPVHNNISVDDVALARSKCPGLPLLVHPECPVAVSDAADFVGSTSQILEYAHTSKHKELVIGTESGILHMLKKQNPDKKFHMLTNDFICPDMKKATLDDVLNALEHMRYRVELDNETIEKALSSLNRMLNT
jgi:quinolinate synthase